MYKLLGNNHIQKLDGTINSIPMVDGNSHYEEYKQWLSAGNVPEPEFTEEELLAKELLEAKQLADITKQLALDSITVTTTSGKVFDGRDNDQARMLSAIQASDTLVALYTTQFNTIVEPTLEEVEAFNNLITKATTTMWKLNDNTTVEITLDELKEAQALSIQALGNIIVGM